MKNQGTREHGNTGTESVARLLRQALPAIGDSPGTEHDLWPAMLRRLHAESLPRRVHVPWFDWALIGALAALIAVFPAAIPMLLYYLWAARPAEPAERKIAMNSHPYLRAFLAGAFVPTLILPLILTVFILLRLVLEIPVPIERGLVFPMALVPLLWSLWNMLWLGSHSRTHLPIGLHGAWLPLLLVPGGALIGTCLGILNLGATGATWFHSLHFPYVLIAPFFAAALIGYYLMWKYVVGFVNRTLGIA
jgi:hypothetical protein